jgi:hypothetical protein
MQRAQNATQHRSTRSTDCANLPVSKTNYARAPSFSPSINV